MSDFKINPFPRPAPPARPTPPPQAEGKVEAEPVALPPKAIVITDGACSGNPGQGGWGVLIRRGEEVIELHGGDPSTTNNRMEIIAVIEALNALEQPYHVEIISDSEYVIKTMTQSWKRKANTDLWPALDAAVIRHIVSWTWEKTLPFVLTTSSAISSSVK